METNRRKPDRVTDSRDTTGDRYGSTQCFYRRPLSLLSVISVIRLFVVYGDKTEGISRSRSSFKSLVNQIIKNFQKNNTKQNDHWERSLFSNTTSVYIFYLNF